jgi:hypothetical protein
MTWTHPLGALNIEMFHANKLAHFTCCFEPHLYKPEKRVWTFEVCKNVYLHMQKMYVKFRNLIPMLHGSSGLPSVGGDLLTKLPIYLVLLQVFTMVPSFCYCRVLFSSSVFLPASCPSWLSSLLSSVVHHHHCHPPPMTMHCLIVVFRLLSLTM